MDNISKPFSVVCTEFKQSLAELINTSNLPMFVVESVLQNYLNEVNTLAKNQYNYEKSQYEQALKAEMSGSATVMNSIGEVKAELVPEEYGD